MKNKILWIVFVVLILVFVLNRMYNKKPVRSFTEDIVQLDTTAISRIEVEPKQGAGEPFTLERIEGDWKLKINGQEHDAMDDAVASLVSMASDIKAKRIVAKSEEKYQDYELESENAKQIEFYAGDKLEEKLILGKFDFNQQARTATSYIRHKDDKNVYAVDGLLAMSLGGDASSFRDKTLVNIDVEDIVSISLNRLDEHYHYRKQNYWVDSDNAVVDTTAMNQYVTGISNLRGAEIIDNFNTGTSSPIGTLEIATGNEMGPLVVTCYSGTEETSDFVLHSSANRDVYFASDSSGLYDRVFKRIDFRAE